MSVEVGIHRAIAVSAKAYCHGEAHWVDVKFIHEGGAFMVVAYFKSAAETNIYADAINGAAALISGKATVQ